MPCERRPLDGGFTLLELSVVLGILALLAAMTVPLFGRSMSHASLRAAAAELRAALRSAGMQAVAEGRTVAVRGDPSAGYWVDRQHRRLAASGQDGEPWRVIVAGGGAVSFFPWGGSSGGRVRIEGPYGRDEIAVDAATGRAVQPR